MDSRLRELVLQVLTNKDGQNIESITDGVRQSGYVFKGLGNFAVLEVLNDLVERQYLRLEKSKYHKTNPTSKTMPDPPRPPILGKISRVIAAKQLAKKWAPAKQAEFVDDIDRLLQKVELPTTALVLENDDGGWKISVRGKSFCSLGKTVPEAIGNLVVLYMEQLGFKLEVKDAKNV
jgi:hypothetical protein